MAMMQSITFGGVNSADYGIYIGGEGVFNAPKREVEMIEIPGRNGARQDKKPVESPVPPGPQIGAARLFGFFDR